MELYQLRSFVAVSEYGHLTRAADRLHISQPAVSAHIKALEEELDLDLFERRSHGMQLTAAGRHLLAEAQKVLAGARSLINAARTLRGELSGIASVGTLSDPAFIRVGELMNAAILRYPSVEIQLHQEVTGEAFEKVRAGALDASFYYGGLTHPKVAALTLREVVYRIVAPAAWSERIARADWTGIAAEPWVMTPPISTHHQMASGLFQKHAISPTKVVEADNEFVVGSLVVAGLGMGLMREDLALAHKLAGEVCLWKDVRLTTSLQFLYLGERAGDPLIRALLDLLWEVWSLERPAQAAPAPAATLRAAAAG
jgi:DNA-binding transcriptional LysR family regulator